jgi:hypothetical protein
MVSVFIAEYDCVLVLFGIEVQVVPESVEYSQNKTFPVCPLRVKDPVVRLSQIVVLPKIFPPTEFGLTWTIAGAELADAQEPL